MKSVWSKPEGLPPAEMLCFAVYAAGHAFNRVYKPLLCSAGLTYPQYLVMSALWFRNDQKVGELGSQLMLDSSTLTPLLKRLEAAGYVSRRRDCKDERVVRVRLTRAGSALRGKLRDVRRCVLEATGLSVTKARQLMEDVSVLRGNLGRFPDS
jgi:DNA-binding MarR family transcriptional regulator